MSDQFADGEAIRPGRWAVSPYNFAEEIRGEMTLPERVRITDLTLREGRQVAGVAIGLDDVLEYARRADALGIHVLEMHHYEPDEIREVKALGLRARIQALVHPTAALSPDRCRAEIDHCLAVGSDIVSLAVAISDHNYRLVQAMAGLDIPRERIIENLCDAVRYGNDCGATMNVILMDFGRLELTRLVDTCVSFAEAGVDSIRLDDICAPCLPAVCRHHTRRVKQAVGDVPIAIHTHNDFDLALACQLAALEGGAEIFEASVNGLGERAGVPNLAPLVAVLETMYGYDTGIALAGLQALANFVADVWNQPIPPHMPVVGHTAFSHATEVHYFAHDDDGAWAWNSWLPEVVGNQAYVPLCMYSGPNAITRKARELGLGDLSPDVAANVVERVRAELRSRRTEPDDSWFAETVREAAPRSADA